MNIEKIKNLKNKKVSSEQWKEIRNSDCVKLISLQGKERGISDYLVVFNDSSSVMIYI